MVFYHKKFRLDLDLDIYIDALKINDLKKKRTFLLRSNLNKRLKVDMKYSLDLGLYSDPTVTNLPYHDS